MENDNYVLFHLFFSWGTDTEQKGLSSRLFMDQEPRSCLQQVNRAAALYITNIMDR